MEKTMTTKDIARAVGKEYRAVQNWVSALSAKNAQVSAKIAQARATSKPAQYTLSEACQIIEEGMGPDAAGVYRANAVADEMASTKPKLSGAYLREVRMALGTEAVAAILRGTVPEPKPQPIQIESSDSLPEHVAKQVYAVALNALRKANREQHDADLTPRLIP